MDVQLGLFLHLKRRLLRPWWGVAAALIMAGCTGVDSAAMSGTGMGPPGPSAIGGTIWSDGNEDGALGPGESPLAGAIVSLLLDSNGDGVCSVGEPLYATTESAPDGSYLFSSLPDGDYCVAVDALAGLAEGPGEAPVVSIGAGQEEGVQLDIGLVPEVGTAGAP
jgi:hypothetical protein